MKIFLTGATGLIGRAVLSEVMRTGHTVEALCRSSEAVEAVSASGAIPVAGDLRRPTEWSGRAVAADLIIHTAATWSADMGAIDRYAMRCLVETVAGRALRLIYTGGVWLYGETGPEIRDENAPFDPIASFAWMVETARWLRSCSNVSLAVLHPGLVYDSAGNGALARFLEPQPEILGCDRIRWSLVHVDDLARAYLCLAETPAAIGDFIAVSQPGVPVGEIVREIQQRRGDIAPATILSRGNAIKRYGDAALGPMLDQCICGNALAPLGWMPRSLDYRKELVIARNTT